MNLKTTKSFEDLVVAAMERPNSEGEKTWTVERLADAMGVHNNTVINWRTGKGCRQLRELANKLYGRSDTEAKNQLIEAYRRRQNQEPASNTHDKLTRESTVMLFWEFVLERTSIPTSAHKFLDSRSMAEISWLIRQFDTRIRDSQAMALAEQARLQAFDHKYGVLPEKDTDERHIVGIKRWDDEFRGLLECNSIQPESTDLLVVGLGPGFEGASVYEDFKSFVGLDVSPSAVERARTVFTKRPESIIEGIAEDLPTTAIEKDLYVSLKTFSSSYFDVSGAVDQCFRALRTGGKAIISIPLGYPDADGSITTYGVSRTVYNYETAKRLGTYGIPDAAYAFRLVAFVCAELSRRLFVNIRLHTGLVEYYIIATKKL